MKFPTRRNLKSRLNRENFLFNQEIVLKSIYEKQRFLGENYLIEIRSFHKRKVMVFQCCHYLERDFISV